MKARFRLFVALGVCCHLALSSVFALVTPPWQGPDEPTHLEYILQFQRAGWDGFPFSPDDPLQREILASMATFDYYRLVGVAEPLELPDSFGHAPFITQSWTKLHNPPLYYALCAGVLGLCGVSSLLGALYLCRLIGVILGGLTVVLCALALQEAFPSRPSVAAGGVLTVAFTPQLAFLSGTVNSDNLANLIAAGMFWAAVAILRRGWSPSLAATVAALIVAGGLTKRTTLMALPMVILASWLRSSGKIPHWRQVATAIGGALAVVMGMVLLREAVPLFGGLVTGLVEFREALARMLTGEDAYLGARLALLPKLGIDSYWLTLGWMRFPAGAGWRWGCYAIMALGGIGVVLQAWRLRSDEDENVRRSPLLLAGAFLMAMLVVGIRFFAPDGALQGRYFFVVLGPIGGLLALGWEALAPRRAVAVACLGFLLALQIHAVTGILIPKFYPAEVLFLAQRPGNINWSEVTSLHLDVGKSVAQPYLAGDFYGIESANAGFLWMGERGHLRPPLSADRNWTLSILLRAYEPGTTLEVRAGETTLGTLAPSKEDGIYTLCIPAGAPMEKGLTLVASETHIPLVLGRSTDPRKLSFAVSEVILEADGPRGEGVHLLQKGIQKQQMQQKPLTQLVSRGRPGILANEWLVRLALYGLWPLGLLCGGGALVGYGVFGADLGEARQP